MAAPTSGMVAPRAPAAAWQAAAAAVPRLVRWRRLRTALLVLLALPAALWFASIAPWLLGATDLSPAMARVLDTFRALVGVHLLAVLLAVGPAVRAGAADPYRPRLHRLARRYAARGERLRDLRRLLLAETALLFAWTPLAAWLLDARLQWGPAFTVAAATLWLVWPLERIARAQQREGERLAARSAGGAHSA